MSEIQSTEEWRDVPGFPGYQVSNLGRARSSRQGGRCRPNVGYPWRILKPYTLPNGYQTFKFSVGKLRFTRYVHRLVLEAFVGPCPPGMECRHFPERDKTNNRLENLSWSTHGDNLGDMIAHGTRRRGSQMPAAKLTEEEAAEVLQAVSQGDTVLAQAKK